MSAFKLPDGRVLIPMRAEGPHGVIGDGLVPVPGDSPEAKEWTYDMKPASDFLINYWRDKPTGKR